MRRLGHNHNILIGLSVAWDVTCEVISTHILELDHPTLGIDREHLLQNDKAAQVYFQLIFNAVYVLKTNDSGFHDYAQQGLPVYRKMAYEIFSFETMLANISLPLKERKVSVLPSSRHYTIKKLMLEVPEIDWLRYFRGIVDNRINENENVMVKDIYYIKKLVSLINETDKRVVYNYMMWRVVHQTLPSLSRYWRTLAQRPIVNKEKIQEKPRWEYCLSSVRDHFGSALESYYVKSYFREESKGAIHEVYKYIKKEFLFIMEHIPCLEEYDSVPANLSYIALKNTSCVEDIAKTAIEDMLKEARATLGNLIQLADESYVSEMYKNLTLNDENFFRMVLKTHKQQTDYSFSLLRGHKTEKGCLSQDPCTEAGTIPILIFAKIHMEKAKNMSLEFKRYIIDNYNDDDTSSYLYYDALEFPVTNDMKGKKLIHVWEIVFHRYNTIFSKVIKNLNKEDDPEYYNYLENIYINNYGMLWGASSIFRDEILQPPEIPEEYWKLERSKSFVRDIVLINSYISSLTSSLELADYVMKNGPYCITRD